MNVVILHGIGGYAGIHWQQWLHDELTQAGYTVVMPSLTDAEHPNRTTWLKEIESVCQGLDLSQTIMIGHSLGVATALDFIEKQDTPIKAFIAVSGFAYAYGAELNDYFMKERIIDFTKVNKNLDEAFVFYGDNDPYVTQDALNDLSRSLNVKPIVIPKGGHLNSETGFKTFPKLLEVVQDIS